MIFPINTYAFKIFSLIDTLIKMQLIIFSFSLCFFAKHACTRSFIQHTLTEHYVPGTGQDPGDAKTEDAVFWR